MRRIVTLTILAALFLLSDVSWARRDALTAEQKNQLERIDRVLIEVLALSDKGAVDARTPGRGGGQSYERIRLYPRDRSGTAA